MLRCDQLTNDHTGIFLCDGCARDPYFYVPDEKQDECLVKVTNETEQYIYLFFMLQEQIESSSTLGSYSSSNNASSSTA